MQHLDSYCMTSYNDGNLTDRKSYQNRWLQSLKQVGDISGKDNIC